MDTEDSYCSDVTDDFDRSYDDGPFPFVPPPEAPVFEPTKEEFMDPLQYINKIRPVAERSGICKIRPPSDWQPPFSIDVDKFKFTPRVQRLNELEAKTRIKLNFIDQIAKFWELQGSPLRIPSVERRALDLYTLHKLVQSEGGLEIVTKDRKWSKIACKMHFPTNRAIGSMLKGQYEKILYPYDVFQKKKEESVIKKKEEEEQASHNISLKTNEKEEGEPDTEYKPSITTTKPAKKLQNGVKRNSTESKLPSQNVDETIQSNSMEFIECKESGDNKELRRLQFYGAGPKMAGYNKRKREEEDELKNKTRGKKVAYDVDPLAKYVCRNCDRGDMEESMLLCDGCDDSYHIFCLTPPLTEIPKGDWRCPKCVAVEVSKPTEAFGFEQAQREYSLQQFGEMADKFKHDYFNMPGHEVHSSTVEKEFWRIVASIDEDVTVEYGADLHTMDHGSGFPTNEMFKQGVAHPMLKEYADSGWNLNNLPVLKGSILGHIDADISGMKVPWMYVGMCFATFCWHNEDHWSYSINYLHWGEPKTWYGVPGSSAEAFESAMKDAAPELFQSQPDLLHQLVTIMNPNELMAAGVPICRTDQTAGEFVITFPRAYHAGFNQGYNFAEAVNFAPADWLKIGRDCITHYSSLHRFCVFSHDELVCKMAKNPDALEPRIATATYQDMLQMVSTEKKFRKSLLEWGVYVAERVNFEALQDDERQCEICKTMCYVSAVSCPCSKVLVCLRHYTELCECSPDKHILKYRYTLDELHSILQNLKVKSDSFDSWVKNVKAVLDSPKPKVIDFDRLKELSIEAIEKRFPESDLFHSLMSTIEDAERCTLIARQLTLSNMDTELDNGETKLTVEELKLFCKQVDNLACKIKEEVALKQLLNSVEEFQEEAKKVLTEEIVESGLIGNCIKAGAKLDIDLEEMPKLKDKYYKMRCTEEINVLKNSPDKVTADCLRMILKSKEMQDSLEDVNITLAGVKELLKKIEEWEEKTNDCLTRKLMSPLIYAENLLKEAENIKAHLPSKVSLIDAIEKAKEWKKKVKNLLSNSHYPYVDELTALVIEGENIPLSLEEIQDLKARIRAVQYWKEKASRIFLRRNSFLNLMESISPRTECGVIAYRERKKKVRNGTHKPSNTVAGVEITSSISNEKISEAFHAAEKLEKEKMCDLRLSNIKKKNHGGSNTQFCLCRQPVSGQMVECTLCREWFHKVCVGKGGMRKQRNQSETNDFNFLCPFCLRTKRPKLDSVMQLLINLQKIPARFPESEALRCLANRAANWSSKAIQLLKNEELISAQVLMSNSKEGEANCDDRLKDDYDSTLKADSTLGGSMPISAEEGNISNELLPVKGPCSPPQLNSSGKISTCEITVKKIIKTCTKKEQEKPVVTLSKAMRIELKQLLMEGDLMEVTMQEKQLLWRIAQATKPYSASTNKVEDKNDEEEYCAAMNCLRPCPTVENDAVDWVQCDGGCDKWFHMVCVGLHKTDIREDEDFICQNCTPIHERMSDTSDMMEINDQTLVKQEPDDNLSLSNCDLSDSLTVDDELMVPIANIDDITSSSSAQVIH